MLKKYPKVQQLGERYTKKIYEDEVEITEKLDGSQFRFGLVDGNLVCCSKGAIIDIDKPDKLFAPAVEYCKVLKLKGALDKPFIYFGETLSKPKHNTLKYDNVPLNNIALFAIYDVKKDSWYSHNGIVGEATRLDVDYVPLLFKGVVVDEVVLDWIGWYDKLLDTDSNLGGTKIEGFVVKNLHRETLIGDVPVPFIQGKFVSEKFKEKHGATWKNKGSSNSWGAFKERYKTEARWDKAIQHLREKWEVCDSPSDIGKLITEIKRDIKEECEEEIRDFLWKHFGSDLLRQSTHGFPEYYKKLLLINEANNCNEEFKKGRGK